VGLSRDVDLAALSCTIWPLESIKLDYLFSDIFLNISKTVRVRKCEIFITYACQWDATFITFNIFWYNAPVDFEKWKTKFL